jgi:DMSO/TMAO reductase YedYZ molybdopterin-dependent catalytic subunit
LTRLLEGDVLLAYELNGAALDSEHGNPLRLIIPGFYGTNSAKWLYRLELSERRPRGPFTTRYYNDPIAPTAENPAGGSKPV